MVPALSLGSSQLPFPACSGCLERAVGDLPAALAPLASLLMLNTHL